MASTEPILVHVHGAGGRMGRESVRAVRGAPDMELTGTTGRGDDLRAALGAGRTQVLVEFTDATVLEDHVAAALACGTHVVSGTTGLDRDAVERLGRAAATAGRALLLAPNFCIGVLLMQRFAEQAARWFAEVEIVEYHHDRKEDAPSGTALHTADRIAAVPRPARDPGAVAGTELLEGARGARRAGIPVHAVRLPGLLAHQEILFGAVGQVLTLRHDATDRQCFMPGVLLGIRGVLDRTGLIDSLDPLLDGGAGERTLAPR